MLTHWRYSLSCTDPSMSSAKWRPFCPGGTWVKLSIWPQPPCVNLEVRGTSYLGLTWSISWLLMPWLLASPGHQQPWYWLSGSLRRQDISNHDIDYVEWVSPGLIRGRISIIFGMSVWRDDMKCKYMFMYPLKKFSTQRVKHCFPSSYIRWCPRTNTLYPTQHPLVVNSATSHSFT